jgi:hypothetical protein
LRFYEKKSSKEDDIKKGLQTMLPFDRILEHQYRTRNYQHYAVLIHDLLQDDKHDELNIKNHHQYRVEAAALPEIHHNEKKANFSKENNMKKNGRCARCRCNRGKNMQLAKTIKSMVLPLKGVIFSVGHAVVSSILLRNAVHPST